MGRKSFARAFHRTNQKNNRSTDGGAAGRRSRSGPSRKGARNGSRGLVKEREKGAVRTGSTRAFVQHQEIQDRARDGGSRRRKARTCPPAPEEGLPGSTGRADGPKSEGRSTRRRKKKGGPAGAVPADPPFAKDGEIVTLAWLREPFSLRILLVLTPEK